MINIDKLRGLIRGKGYTEGEFAKEVLSLSPQTLSGRFKSGIFGSDEIEKMIDKLNIEKPQEIFFVK